MSNKIGTLWLNKEKKFMKGNIEIDGRKIKIIIFRNKKKTKDSQPDYDILESEER
ncbi:hypothetical protein [Brachyspira innocens]|uniref:hypothetical protein n=1 Tax=Brachyspira innocens TaxID=13264 RepID=UPI0026F319A4|nr:hypothetical protein [Brachyspira innocens]